MDKNWYQTLIKAGIDTDLLPKGTYTSLLTDSSVELLSLLDAAFTVRKHFHGKTVTAHIINNVSNGLCSEDCNYCPQSKTALLKLLNTPKRAKKKSWKKQNRLMKPVPIVIAWCMPEGGPANRGQNVSLTW